MSQKILFITPPFTQLNTPYPATAYLKGFLNNKNIPSFQCDLGIEVILALFSAKKLNELFALVSTDIQCFTENTKRIYQLKNDYIQTIDLVIQFLQNKNPSLAYIICEGDFLPEASRFEQLDDLEWAFGSMGIQDKAKHLATLYLEDIGDFITEIIDPHFGFSRYAEHLGRWANEFDELNIELNKPNTLIDNILIELLEQKINNSKPTIVALSVPFPGNLYSAFKCAQWIKIHYPEIKIVMGGGFANTELRSLFDPKVFKYLDFVCLDDGERPLLNIIEYIDGTRNRADLKRTFSLENNKVIYLNGSKEKDFSQHEIGTPDYSDFQLDNYLSVIEIVNPMHRLWSDGWWNKLTIAHACYWAQCSFCDTSLDYIKRYEPNNAKLLCNRIEEIIGQTAQTGFHFVDEAAPPALLRDLAIEILRRKITVVWWTNIRFEKNFTYDLCRLLAASGCIAVSGGLEVASDRLLKLINKGVTIEQVAKVTENFTRARIMVHAYLMYGFPTQTAQETIDSLEVVRQLFEEGIVQSGFWHRFAMTTHSPVGMNPKDYHTIIENSKPGSFANNDIAFKDPKGTDHEKFSEGLRKSLFNYMHGICFDFPLNLWFDFKVPQTTISPRLIHQFINEPNQTNIKLDRRLIWIGNHPEINYFTKTKKGKAIAMAELVFNNKKNNFTIQNEKDIAEWLLKIITELSVYQQNKITVKQFEESYTRHGLANFQLFLYSKSMDGLRENGLLVL